MRRKVSVFYGKWHRGLTLMESVIALGVIAATVPIMLSATAVTSRTRRHAEADTRSAWLAREVQRELTHAWQGMSSEMFPQKPSFPVLATEAQPEILLFDAEGRYLSRGTEVDLQRGMPEGSAQYMVLLHAVAHPPANMTVAALDTLSHVHLRVAHSARAPRAKRAVYSYSLLIPRQTPP